MFGGCFRAGDAGIGNWEVSADEGKEDGRIQNGLSGWKLGYLARL